jgi:hypothetical protein
MLWENNGINWIQKGASDGKTAGPPPSLIAFCQDYDSMCMVSHITYV